MKETVRIVIAGDLLPSGKNEKLFEEGNAQAVFGDRIIELFRDSDYSIFNLEGPLTDTKQLMEKTGPSIKASSASIEGIANLGVKAVALANNHITDCQKAGYEDTLKLLQGKNIDYLGAGYSGNIKKNLSLTIRGKRICIYNVSELFYNVATSNIPGVNLYDEYIVCNEIKELKQTHDYLIVIYHGGCEEFQYPTPLVQKRFRRMADCGADFITAQHTHCIGCFEEYNGSYLLYGQGNFLFARMKDRNTKRGLVSEIILSDEGTEVHNHLVCVNEEDVVRYDSDQVLDDFYHRSEELADFETVIKKYRLFAYNQKKIKNRFLSAYRGDTVYYRILKAIAPKFFQKHVLEKYKREQLLRIAKSLESERTGEDMLSAVTYMLENK